MDEEALYQPIKDALNKVFSAFGECYLEISKTGISEEFKKELDNFAIFYIRIDRQYPDIAGFLQTENAKEFITVEVKKRVSKMEDIFQAKRYAEVFNATYGFLICQSIDEEVKRFLKERPLICSRSRGNQIIIAQFEESSKNIHIIKELYSPILPKPFGSPPQVYYFVSREHPRVVVKGEKAYWMFEKMDRLVTEGKLLFEFVKLSDKETYKDWLKKNGLKEMEWREPTNEELEDP